MLVALLGAALAWAGCQKQGHEDASIGLRWTLDPDPPVIGPATLALVLTDSTSGEPVTGAVVRVEGNMTHPGMKPVLGAGREVAPGRYEAPLQFTMGGDWVLLIDATLPGGRTLHRQVDVRGVRSR